MFEVQQASDEVMRKARSVRIPFRVLKVGEFIIVPADSSKSNNEAAVRAAASLAGKTQRKKFTVNATYSYAKETNKPRERAGKAVKTPTEFRILRVL